MSEGPDVVIIMTDEERAAPSYEPEELRAWRRRLAGAAWFEEHAVVFDRHYTGSLACVPSRPTMFTGHYPDVHGVTQTDGLGKMANDSRMRWMRPGEVPTLGNWFRAAGYDTHYDGKWHITHADLHDDATGRPLATNDAAGNVLTENVAAYLAADPLAPYGFSGWVGPEPHGGLFENSGLVRDPLAADRVSAWLEDRYARRRSGDAAALRPFLLVVSFVNPHDIVLFPLWLRRGIPDQLERFGVPAVPAPPSADEDLSTKPAAHLAYRWAYLSCYGPAAAVDQAYRDNAQRYRDLYYQLHAAVDASIDRVRRAVTDGATTETLIVRTADHGELLGAHGGLHQKWFQLYDEAARVPFSIARVGGPAPTRPRHVSAPTSHVDLVPTLLAAAGIDDVAVGAALAETFSEVHPLPGRNLMPVVDGSAPDDSRVVYVMTRDNMPEGDSGASAVARQIGRAGDPPGVLRIEVPAYVASNFEAIVCRVSDEEARGGAGHLWKLVRTFDDPAAWTHPGTRQLASDGIGGPVFRDEVLPDQWELYDLDSDPIEVVNRAVDPDAAAVFDSMTARLADERQRSVPPRNAPWPYTASRMLQRRPALLPPRQFVARAVTARLRRRATAVSTVIRRR